MCFELQVDSAQAAYEDMKPLNAPIVCPLTVEPFGQKRFGILTRQDCGLMWSNKPSQRLGIGMST